MSSSGMRRLVALQNARSSEIEGLRNRLLAKPRASLNKNIVQARIEALKEIWAEARKTHSDITIREEAGRDPYVTEDQFGRLQEIFESALDECLTLRAQFELADDTTVSVERLNSSASASGSDSCLAKLPRIPLPTFSGKYEDWDSFRDIFTSLVHNASHVSDATKLQYLKLCLTGSAAELLKDVMTTSANYSSAWKALQARYYNPRLTINKHLSAFMELPHLKRESAEELPFVHRRGAAHYPESRKQWEAELSSRDRRFVVVDGEQENLNPSYSSATFADLSEFLERRAQALGMITAERRGEKRAAPLAKSAFQPRKVFHASSSRPGRPGPSRCPLCGGPHIPMRCSKFREKPIHERRREVRRLQLCFNCLGQHRVNSCPSSSRCSVCQGRHHTLIHAEEVGNSLTTSSSTNAPKGDQGKPGATSAVVSLHAAKLPSSPRKILLATARVLVIGPEGRNTYARALLDQGSEASFISESIAQSLKLPKRHTCVPLSGLGASASGTARSAVQVTLRSAIEATFQVETELLVLPRLTALLPIFDVRNYLDLAQFSDLVLSDPEFTVPRKVDLLLGADLYGRLLLSGLKRVANSELVAQRTVFGWIVSGPVSAGAARRAECDTVDSAVQAFHCTPHNDLDQALQRFWALEEVPASPHRLKPEDEKCEVLFQNAHRRSSQGRYIVSLPLKGHLPSMGAESRRLALSSLSHMHRRFSHDPKLALAYREFMEAYEKLGHMSRVPPSLITRPDAWYLPHHAVVQEAASNWKLRVVFDASRRTRDGHSLNSWLLTGPPLQGDLSLILLNWRRYRYAFTADIVKMFRQIQVRPEDQDFQRIVWAPDATSEPVDFRLTTVTYGTACAPYLAIRTLSQLAKDEGDQFPDGAHCLLSETYVDDTFSGADDLSTAIRKRTELCGLLASAGIELDKWAANHSELLPNSARSIPEKQIEEEGSIKTLGVNWVPSQDKFRFSASGIEELSAAHTKRTVLSNIARLFDPLGWLSPVTVTAKVLLQDMWILKCDWDTPLPAEIRERWHEYCKGLAALPTLSIDRWLGAAVGRSFQIHGFSDASARAYAAVVYVRIDEGTENSHVSLLTAKSKVAPVKTVSIPNLELCGAVLLVKLLRHVTRLEFLQETPIFAWSDSQIVLTWLRKHPCHWKTFVANRVSMIQTELPLAVWAHVPTKENPADLATRGVQPEELADIAIW